MPDFHLQKPDQHLQLVMLSLYKTGLLAGESIRKKPAIPTRNAIEVTAKHKPTYSLVKAQENQMKKNLN